jgi:hypothetical protein
MMSGRKPVLIAMALVALGLSALVATKGLPVSGAETSDVACSSCDARQQNHMRLVAKREAETTP